MRLTQKIARLLWPRQNCPVCGAPLKGESICPRCRGILAAYAACPRCACFTPLERRPEHACPPGAETASMLACFPYMAELRERLHRLKYHGKAEIAADFGPLLAERWREFAANKITAAAIVPVPLHPARFAERGYNQSELLARALAREIGLPVYARAVSRVKNTAPQHELSPAERSLNLRGAFAAGPDIAKVRSQNIILLDDIITTGATAANCAAVLRAGGAANVYVLAVAAHAAK